MSLERIPVEVYEDSKQASTAVARRIARFVAQRKQEGRKAVLGLATGHTPINVYAELIRLHKAEGLDLSNVVTFNLDEYWPIQHAAMQSYHVWMHEHFFDHVNIPAENIHIPSGECSEADLPQQCAAYERAIVAAGGIDIQILGIGLSGHVGFNEPGSARDSLTRRVTLDGSTRKAAASDFFGLDNVPEMAVTMGVGTILAAREIHLLAFGEHKAKIVRRAVEGEITPSVAATYLQQHANARFFVDEAAAAELTRQDTPWLIGHCRWDELLTRHAVIWLAKKMGKPILKLTDEDYAENGLGELRSVHGGAYKLNIAVFRHLMDTITGWPGGKETKRRVLILSPHPDDDVICMAGTMERLVEQGHEVHVAYMVSGYLSVFDHDVSRYADFVREFNRIFGLTPDQTAAIEERIDKALRHKRPGEVDTPNIQAIKGFIRRSEAIDAATYCGLTENHMHFLDMPFYNTGKIQKSSIGPADVAAVTAVLEKVQPDTIYAAGDLSDPHGTHRLCLEAALVALDRYNQAHPEHAPEMWLYRGAWQEWPAEQIDMAVPLSPGELQHKRFAIFRHQSQKDQAMFPGPFDSREFWQRAEERNTATAKLYDELGLPEYHAIEAFAHWPIKRSANTQEQLAKE